MMFMQDQLYRIVKNLKKILQFLDKKLCRTSGVIFKTPAILQRK